MQMLELLKEADFLLKKNSHRGKQSVHLSNKVIRSSDPVALFFIERIII